jgi:hypothetical protein
LKAVLLDDADDTASADREAGLAELLRDNVNRRVRIEEPVTDDLANDLVRADIVAFGAGLVPLEFCASMFTIEFEQLMLARFGQVQLGRTPCASGEMLRVRRHAGNCAV